VRRVALLLATSLLHVSAQAAQPAIPVPASDNQELKSMYEADQADRKPQDGAVIDWQRVSVSDRARERRTKELYRANELRTGADYYHAALILQHASSAEDYLLAHEFCVVAVAKGESRAGWLAAATQDRFLLAIGRPQRFGTQITSGGGAPINLDESANAATDALRAALDVPPPTRARPVPADPATQPTSQASHSSTPILAGAIDKAIVGHWAGRAPDETKVDLIFSADGKLAWTVGANPVLHGRFATRPGRGVVEVDFFGFSMAGFEELRILGIAKISRDKFTLVCSKMNGDEPGAAPVSRPTEFGSDTIEFRRMNR